ncbi:MAG: hypothetical protein PUB96_08710 [Helicobacteraceae bacterium]|nr:hypothetical protein [Helicobacteraceae bacterium]
MTSDALLTIKRVRFAGEGELRTQGAPRLAKASLAMTKWNP